MLELTGVQGLVSHCSESSQHNYVFALGSMVGIPASMPASVCVLRQAHVVRHAHTSEVIENVEAIQSK